MLSIQYQPDWLTLTLTVQLRQCLSAFWTVKLLYSPSPALFSLQRGHYMQTALTEKRWFNYVGIFYKSDLPFPTFINLFNHCIGIYMAFNIYFIPWIVAQYYFIYCIAQTVPASDTGCSFSRFPWRFDGPHACGLAFLLFFKARPGMTGYSSKLIFYISLYLLQTIIK